MPDNPLCDDGWLETYGYILLVVDGGEFGLPSLLFNGLPSEFDVVSVELCDEMCELINGWNCGYFGSMLSNRNFDIAHTNLVSLLPLIVHLIECRKRCNVDSVQTKKHKHSTCFTAMYLKRSYATESRLKFVYSYVMNSFNIKKINKHDLCARTHAQRIITQQKSNSFTARTLFDWAI